MGNLEEPGLMHRYRLSVKDYYRMAEAGVFALDARTELIEGEIINMAPIGTRHGSAVKRLIAAITDAVGKRATLAVQDPVRLGDYSEPQPDLMVLNPRADFYASAHPQAMDVLLLIEVSDTTAGYDRRIKVPLYARHGITEVWIVDLDDRLLRVFRQPQGETYAETLTIDQPQQLPIAALPGISIDLSGVLV